MSAAAIVVLLLWPGIHFVLCKTKGVNPWKLGGWAMYVVRSPAVNVRVRVEPPGLGRMGEACERERQKFLVRRNSVGSFARPDALARCLRQPSEPGNNRTVFVDVAERVFDGDSRTFAVKMTSYSY